MYNYYDYYVDYVYKDEEEERPESSEEEMDSQDHSQNRQPRSLIMAWICFGLHWLMYQIIYSSLSFYVRTARGKRLLLIWVGFFAKN